MDKNTLSNYGWVVIAVLVLAVMIALATPFGEYIKAGVESTAQGLFDVQENALNVVGMSAKTDETEKASASGSYISVNDVSTKTHNLKVNLSSDTITDFSSVSVSRYGSGSNLLDISKMLDDNLVDNGDGTYTFTRIGDSGAQRMSATYNVFIPAGVPFVVSVKEIESTLSGSFLVYITCDDGTLLTSPKATDTVCITSEKNVVSISLMVMVNKTNNGEYITFSEPRLNIGEYCAYQEYTAPQTVTANADGSVSGLTSTSPYMILVSDNDDVTINCEYSKKKQ